MALRSRERQKIDAAYILPPGPLGETFLNLHAATPYTYYNTLNTPECHSHPSDSDTKRGEAENGEGDGTLLLDENSLRSVRSKRAAEFDHRFLFLRGRMGPLFYCPLLEFYLDVRVVVLLSVRGTQRQLYVFPQS